MCGIPQSSRVIVTLAASRDQRVRSVREGVGDCAAAVEASAAQTRTSLLKDLVQRRMAAKICMNSNQCIAPNTERGEPDDPVRRTGLTSANSSHLSRYYQPADTPSQTDAPHPVQQDGKRRDAEDKE